MHEVEINGITVIFPFKPYKEQMDYMTKVIQCLQNGKHGVLESPTGTGKTLSLLCASLSWLQTRKAQLQAQAAMTAGPPSDTGGKFLENLSHDLQNAAGTLGPLQNRTFGMSMPKIIYASRTHSQLSQAMQELKRTAYKHVKVAVIGSRDQLCIHPEVAKEESSSGKIHNCQARVRAKKCIFHINVEKNKDDPVFKNEICDIEDLVKNGQKLKCCPYYLAKDLKETADITFMPYNYLLDPKTRKLQGIDLQNHILLIDEAHNVEKTCEEAASLEISSTDIALCIDEVTKVMKDIADQLSEDIGMLLEGPGNNLQKDFTPDDLCILKDLLLAFEKAVDGIPLEMGKSGETKAGSYIFEILAEAGLTHGKEHAVIDKLDKIILYLSTVNSSPFMRGGNALHKFSTFLKTVFSSTGSNPSEHKKRVEQAYKVYIEPEKVKSEGKTTNWDPKKPERKSRAKSINYWCFSPAFGMRQLLDQGVHSIILTSGTLSPLGPFIEELGIPVDYQLSNPHIVSQKQIWAGIVKQGPDDFQLNSSHETRNDSRYIHSLGRTVLSFAKIVPDGLLVFFPSYPMMEKCRGEWQREGLWSLMTAVKPIFVEPQGKTHFNAVMEEFYKKVRDPEHRGAIFLAVCRGKVSEGLDFADANGRAVLITGLPFTPVNDPKIKLKRQYLEELRATKRSGLSGIDWYVLSALRAVNQAVGRIIRHKDDYGAIIFCDLRFNRSDLMQKLSAWLRPSIKVYDKFGPVVRNLSSFFKQATSTLPQPTATRSAASSAPDGGSSFENITRIRETPTTFSQMSATIDYNFDEDFEALHVYEKKPEGETSTLKTSADSSKPSSINFGTLKAVGGWSISELVRPPVSDEPAAKRRKFNIQPKEIMYDPMPSTSGVSHNVQDSANGQNKKTPDKKKETGKLYLNEVKKSLTQANYKIFATMISTYTSTGDFDELMKTLDRLFPTGSGLEHLLKGFRTYLKKHHLAQFDARIK